MGFSTSFLLLERITLRIMLHLQRITKLHKNLLFKKLDFTPSLVSHARLTRGIHEGMHAPKTSIEQQNMINFGIHRLFIFE